jgi:uncharacterized protein (DUF58 family)
LSLRQNALLLVLLAALIAIAGAWSDDPSLERWWRAPVGLLLLGLAYEAAMNRRAGLQLTMQGASRWLLCRSAPLRMEWRAALGRSVSAEIAVSAPDEFAMARTVESFEIAAAQAGVLSLNATPRRLGRFDWPRQETRLNGVLGLASWRRRIEAKFQVEVVPDIVHQDERALDATVGGARAAARVGAGGEILQLRDYRPGDAPRAIDWKASARAARLISRDFSEDQHLEIILALDVSRSSALAAGGSDRLALYVNIAARLAQRAAMLDDRVGLLLYADAPMAALAPGRGSAAVTRVRSLLSQARTQPVEANPALAAMRIRALARQRALVVMLTDLDDAGMASALIGAARLLRPKHLPFFASVASEEAQALSQRHAADELDVFQAIAAQRYCAGLSRNVDALRALGAACVLAPANALDAAVLDAYLEFRRRRRV